MLHQAQGLLFPVEARIPSTSDEASSTFTSNMVLPVHRWFRYSAGFSADWVESVIAEKSEQRPVRVFDPFAGSGTTLVASENAGVKSMGIDSHPFVSRIAQAKLAWRSDPESYWKMTEAIRTSAKARKAELDHYPSLIRSCYDDEPLAGLDVLRQAYELERDESDASLLSWLTLVAILRKVSKAGTAQWQYILPKKQKRSPVDPWIAFDQARWMIYGDMKLGRTLSGPRASFIQTDARTCDGVPDNWANLVITSPPYPNNYDYADAMRLEMSFMGEIRGWSDLQDSVRQYLIRSCCQHVPAKAVDLDVVLQSPELAPIRDELAPICHQLAEVRESKGGKKTYHLMVACYFRDIALVWQALRRVCDSPSEACFVIGDSAPYAVYVPVVPWMGKLALAAGFSSYTFEKTRDRNIKWKNRKHRVPLLEGRLWVQG